MVLPFGINNNINNVDICLKELITNHYGFKDFDVMIINSHQNTIKNLKNEIKNSEINAQANHKKGLILLAGTQCHSVLHYHYVILYFYLIIINQAQELFR